MKGKKVWNNGVKNKYSNDKPGANWVLGRLSFSDEYKEKLSLAKRNKKIWNNGIKNKYSSEPLGSEWVLGRLKK